MTIDYTTDAGRVRLLITDANESDFLFADDQITAFLAMSRDSNVKRAAATALRVIAVNETLVQKRIKLLDLTTDGPAEAEALRKLAEAYEADADIDDLAEVPLDTAEWINDPFSEREFRYKEGLRSG